MILVIISDTQINKVNDSYHVLEAPLREIESIAKHFKKIYWIGYFNEKKIKSTRLPYEKNICLVPLKKSGGKSFLDKIYILLLLPYYLYKIYINLNKADVLHLRAPSLPAFLGLVLNLKFKINKGWIKYAGDWESSNVPKFYSFQRFLFKKYNRIKTTILSKESYENNLIYMHNPCFYKNDIKLRLINKTNKINIIFVGSLDNNKRPDLIVKILNSVKLQHKINEINFCGEGPLKEKMTILSAKSKYKINIHGSCSREKINKLYEFSHVLILLSKSEGFPKVIAEGALFGCIPIVTNLNGISNVIVNKENGYLLDQNDLKNELIQSLMEITNNKMIYEKMSANIRKILPLFTYEKFENNIIKTFLK